MPNSWPKNLFQKWSKWDAKWNIKKKSVQSAVWSIPSLRSVCNTVLWVSLWPQHNWYQQKRHATRPRLAGAPQWRRSHVRRISFGGGGRDYNHAARELELKRRWTTVQTDLTVERRMERKAVVKLDGEESTRKWLTLWRLQWSQCGSVLSNILWQHVWESSVSLSLFWAQSQEEKLLFVVTITDVTQLFFTIKPWNIFWIRSMSPKILFVCNSGCC